MEIVIKIGVLLYFVLFISCASENQENIAAKLDDEIITLEELDELIIQQLYDELSRIYLARDLACEELINEKVLRNYARQQNTTIEIALATYIKLHSSKSEVQTFRNKNFENGRVIDLTNELKFVDINTSRGQFLVEEKYNSYLRRRLVDSLRKEYKIEKFLQPPLSPSIHLSNIIKRKWISKNPSVEVIFVSDPECSKCKEYYPIYKELMDEYSDNVQFSFTYYSSFVSISSVALEASFKQNKYWEMHDKLYTIDHYPDSAEIVDIAEEIGIEKSLFLHELGNKENYNSIEKNLETINKYGVYATPTVIVNNKFIFDSSSKKEIENAIIEALKE